MDSHDGPHRRLVRLPLLWSDWYHLFIHSISSFRIADPPAFCNSTWAYQSMQFVQTGSKTLAGGVIVGRDVRDRLAVHAYAASHH